jgi:hypothetical protein
MQVITRERNNREWREAHRKHITASDIPAALARRESLRYQQLVERLALDFEGIGLHSEESPDSWHEQHEQLIAKGIATYRLRERQSVLSTGFCVSDNFSWLGASPHGLIGLRGAIHIRPRRSLRSFMEKRSHVSAADRARLHTIMFVCDREWIDLVDVWDGDARVPDRLHRKRVAFEYSWFSDIVLTRLITLWRDVAGVIDRRKMVRS